MAVSVEELRKLTRDLPVDLYLRISESNYCQVFSGSTGLDYSRLASYRRKGVTHLFVRPAEKETIERHLTERRVERILADPSIRAEQKAGAILNLTEQTLAEVFTDFPIQEADARESRKLVTHYLDLMVKQPQSLAAMLRLFSQGDYLNYHSVAVSVFSAMLAQASGRYSADDVLLISWGGLLHDLGASRMQGETFCDPLGQATGKDRENLDAHCRYGLEMVRECAAIPKEVGYIVYQHHEAPDRSGSPNGLGRSSIHPPAMLVAVVDAWSALISRREGREAVTPQRAIQLLSEQALQGKYDPDAVEWLKKLFGAPATSNRSAA